MSIYRNLKDEIRLRFDITEPIKVQDLLELVGDNVHTDDESFDTLLGELAEAGYRIDFPEDEEEFHAQLGTAIASGARDSVHIWMRELAALDLLTRDQELEYARGLNSSLSEMMAAMATIKRVSLYAKDVLVTARDRGKLHRVLEGFLDNVTKLPTVERKTGKETTTEKKPPFDLQLAEKRIARFLKAIDNYFDVPIRRRTKKSKLELEESLRCFKFTTIQLNAMIEVFKDDLLDYFSLEDHFKRVCADRGLAESRLDAVPAAIATEQSWKSFLSRLPAATRNNLKKSPLVERIRIDAMKQASAVGQYAEGMRQSWDRFLHGDEQRNRARDGLAEGNYRLVMSVAQKFKNRGVDHEDLIQEGNLGLLRAIEKFDYTRGFKFSTYATWWIRQAVTRALGEYSRTVRLPANVNQDIRAVTRAQQQLRQELGGDPTVEMISSRIAKTPKQVRDTQRFVLEARTLDKPVGDDDDGTTLGDLLPDNSMESPGVIADSDAMKEAVLEAFTHLSSRETQIVMMHHGIARVEPMTITQIAEELQVSRERVRQLYTRAIKRLERGPQSKALRSHIA